MTAQADRDPAAAQEREQLITKLKKIQPLGAW